MRTKIITFMLLAGTVVGCASNPPPPPPMPMAAPAPAPAPMAMGPFDGVYRGTPMLADGMPKTCPKMVRPMSVRVLKNSTFTMNGVKATIAPDGSITSATRRGMSVSGTASAGSLAVTSVRGKCTYMTTLTKA